MLKRFLAIVFCGVLAVGCSDKKSEEAASAPAPQKVEVDTANTETVKLAPREISPVKETPFTPAEPTADEEEIARLMEFGVSEDLAKEAVTLGASYHEGGLGNDVEVGDVIYYLTKGFPNAGAWGTDIYTYDSAIQTAGVHAGALKDGEFAIVRLEVLPGQEAYEGSKYNGVETQGYGAYQLSYMIQAKPENAAEEVAELKEKQAEFDKEQNERRPMLTKKSAELSAKSFNGLPKKDELKEGDVFYYIVTGKSHGGTVWGSNPYTFDSDLALSATHAGILKPRERGIVKVEIIEKLPGYEGTTENKIRSIDYGEYGPAMKLEAVPLK